MSERRYDDDEARRIFERASEPLPPRRSVGPGPEERGDGFTLAELQAIGAEAGIEPARVAEAVGALDAPGGRGGVRRVAGLPIGVSRSAPLPADFDDGDWDRLLVDLRETFDAWGKVRVEGPHRSWRNGALQAVVEPVGDGYRLRLRTEKSQAKAALGIGAGGLLMSILLVVIGLMAGEPSKLSGALVIAVMTLAYAGFAVLTLPSWSRTRARQMEAVAERAALGVGD